MAVTKYILKKTPTQVAVKFVGAGGGTSSLTIADMTLDDETVDTPNVKVNITGFSFTVDGLTTVTRNNAVVLSLTEGQDSWYTTQALGASISEQAQANVEVSFGGNGTIIMTLSKSEGFAVPDRQLLKDYER
jgi:hypothetical protein